MDIQLSEEQENILHCYQKGGNLTVVAVAGAGKTTTILLLAKHCPEKQFLVLTYNRRLSDETKCRIKKWNITNVEMQTYHGFCTKYYGQSHNDAMFSKLVTASPNNQMSGRLKCFDTIIIDEMQDMTELYYNFISNKLKHMNESLQMILLGDPRQTIYQFNGGHEKYLLDPETHWLRPFTKCHLDTTYRLTHKITNVVNTLLCSKYPQPFKMKATDKSSNLPVEYHFIDIYFGGQNIIFQQIKEYGLDGVLLIACSVKEKTPVYSCLNSLSAKGVNMCVLKDEEPLDPDVLRNKLVASSIHKQKGCERRCVIIYGLDCSYHTYYGKDKPLTDYLNLIYVACTRSLEKLVIIGAKNHGFLKNWNQSELRSLVSSGDLKVYGKPSNKCNCSLTFKCQCARQPEKILNVTDLVHYRSFSWLNEFIHQPTVKINRIDSNEMELTSEKKAQMKNGLVEHVSNIYGVLIPIIVEFHLYQQIKIIEYIISDRFAVDFKETQLIKHLNQDKRYEVYVIYEKIRKSGITDLSQLIDNFLSDFGMLSVCITCYDSYIYLIHQIDNYDWIEKQYVIDCCERLLNFKNNLQSEQNDSGSNKAEMSVYANFNMVCQHDEHVPVKFNIYGRIDDMIGKSIIEYKVSKNVGDNMHISQLLIYLWLLKLSTGYLFYPNCATTIKIDITDFNKFNEYTTDWFNRLSMEYYQVMLKSKFDPSKYTKKHADVEEDFIKDKNVLGKKCLL